MLIKYNIVRWETKSDWWKSVCFSLPKNFLRAACYVLLITVRESKKAEWENEGKWKAHILSWKFVCASSWLCALAFSSLSLFYVAPFNCSIPQANLQSKYINVHIFLVHKRFHGTHSCFSGEYLNIYMYVLSNFNGNLYLRLAKNRMCFWMLCKA